ncbi:MAG TPA: glycosyltransferase [Xanthobacteraceae bacterium]|nr:glycosyltransferase [Xanthobacteraceae bacterium]
MATILGKKICLNMIVKNEMANLERCLGAVADHIHCWIIGDTGSTDGTQDFIKSFFARRNLPGELHSFPFKNFEQARNAALDCAYASKLKYDYLLFCDADMELAVEDDGFRDRLEGPGYRLLQRSDSGLSYWNTRVVRRDVGARYHGVTHEYVDVPGGTQNLTGVWYRDHASGSNRVDKFERDARLLLEAIEKEPGNERYWFYLAQSYRDGGRTADAATAYAKRADMGGWVEEAWTARLEEARCLRKLGDEGGFVRQALAAFNQRPTRAEPLYDLAHHYREKGTNDVSVLFCEAGLPLKRPGDDILFVEDFVYTAGLREEFSIAANYSSDPARKDRGYAACNWLALHREISNGPRDLAWSNLFFYYQSAQAMMPSFAGRPISFAAPAGYRSTNPSVTRLGNEIVMVQRTVNYTLTADGLRYETTDNGPIRTRNFLLRLDSTLDVQASVEILLPADIPEPVSRLALGFEDLRIFGWHGVLWCNACFRELTPEAWCEQVLARIDETAAGVCRLTDWRILQPEGPREHQKNWMPQVSGDNLRFVYNCDPTRIVNERGETVAQTVPKIAGKNFRGGTQLIAFDEGWLALIHEVQWRAGANQRYYHHRFVWFDTKCVLQAISRPFFFNRKGIEFAAGLAWHPDGRRLLISYGVGDAESWIATVDEADVRALLEEVDFLANGDVTPGAAKRNRAARSSTPAEKVSLEPSEQTKHCVEGNEQAVPVITAAAEVRSEEGARSEASAPRIFTKHQTWLYVDPATGELRHGPDGGHHFNVTFVKHGTRGQIVHEHGNVQKPIVAQPDRCFVVDRQTAPAGSLTPAVFEVVELDRGWVGLKADGVFLCAEPDGRLTLSRKACGAWENFRIADPAHANEPPSNEDVFLKLAPFLRAAGSPAERRNSSREFDARIAPFLDYRGEAALPQIHCFYEVLSEGAEHRTLIAATSSMRAAGHPVRVWTYSPEKLEFLKERGVDIRSAADVVPRGVFEKVLAGSEIRYFSDIFRYAVLYEHGGLWMDADVILLRPFPFRGDHFFNLQWASGHRKEHFVCGNVMYAAPFSRHLRALYEMSIERFFGPTGWEFGEVGPKLLSDYIASDAGAELRERVFSPMFFNAIDWTEVDKFDQPIAELADYLNDERVFGIHLWTARNVARVGGQSAPLISLLSDPVNNLPTFTDLADRFNTDKNRHTGWPHCYARVYDRLLSSRRFSLRKLMEIGLSRWSHNEAPSVALWQSFFPFCHVIGVDLGDFSSLNSKRFSSFVCNQSKREELRGLAAKLGSGSMDVIIDDGSHASFDQQVTLRELFPLLADGGWYFIEDLDWQPPGEDAGQIMITKRLLREIEQYGAARSVDPLGVSALAGQMAEILFFDSHYELNRANLLGGLVAIRKRGITGFSR